MTWRCKSSWNLVTRTKGKRKGIRVTACLEEAWNEIVGR